MYALTQAGVARWSFFFLWNTYGPPKFRNVDSSVKMENVQSNIAYVMAIEHGKSNNQPWNMEIYPAPKW